MGKRGKIKKEALDTKDLRIWSLSLGFSHISKKGSLVIWKLVED